MRINKRVSCIFIVIFMCLMTLTSFAHPGRTDRYGGHNVRTAGWGYPVGSYHYHNSGTITKSNTTNSNTASTIIISTKDFNKIIQKRLNELGYNCGGVDGIIGAKTIRAIKSFQKANYLTVDGVVGNNTKKALEI